MTQEELNHIYVDICLNGKRVEGWSCDEHEEGHVLKDNKRQNIWVREAPDQAWMEKAKSAQ